MQATSVEELKTLDRFCKLLTISGLL